jgi:probable HAF family extracellular repeat protein
MLRNFVLPLTALSGAVLSLGIAAGQPPTLIYTQLDYPGAKSTSASGINSKGDIVGIYTDQANKSHGFLFRRGNFTTIDFPGALGSQALGVNSQGDIVGAYGSNLNIGQAGGDIHGFLLRAGSSIPEQVNYPGHLNTITQRINDSGQIFGCYHDHDTMASMHGIMVSNGVYSALDGSQSGVDMPTSMSNGATPDGSVIAGLFTDMMTNQGHGFVLTGGVFTPFDVPGSTGTSAWDINSSGQVVGQYTDTAGKGHGFLLTNGQFFSIDYPGATATRARGINPQGDVVGFFSAADGSTHAFILSGPPIVVIAGGPRLVVDRRHIFLDGSASTSLSNSTPLTYHWESYNYQATILGQDTATPEIVLAPLEMDFVFLVTVTDSKGNSSTDSITVFLTNANQF